MSASAEGRTDFQIWSTTATLVVADRSALTAARSELDSELADVELACSRFRPDSEVTRLLRTPDVEVGLSPVLNDALTAALRMAAATSYLVDPTVAAAVIALGYDRDIAQLTGSDRGIAQALEIATGAARPAPGAWRIEHNPATRRITIPPGVGLDLGATAKALAADRAAARIAERFGCGVLVGLGGDIAVGGPRPEGGWSIAIGDDHRTAEFNPQVRVAISEGGLATSSTVARRWRTRDGVRHHLIDPRTGGNPVTPWRTASVAAASCLEANAAATAAIILGAQAPAWLTAQRLPSRLVRVDGSVTTMADWPDDEGLAA